MLHLVLHLLLPLALAVICLRATWRRSVWLLWAGIVIDVDHLLADPIYDAERCSIGFHPLHTTLPIVLYAALLLHPKTRVLGMGLCLHILLDWADCH